jgi:hypothetical protein
VQHLAVSKETILNGDGRRIIQLSRCVELLRSAWKAHGAVLFVIIDEVACEGPRLRLHLLRNSLVIACTLSHERTIAQSRARAKANQPASNNWCKQKERRVTVVRHLMRGASQASTLHLGQEHSGLWFVQSHGFRPIYPDIQTTKRQWQGDDIVCNFELP